MSHDLFSQNDAGSPDEEVIPPLSDETLRDLFAAASDVLKIQPWKRLGDTSWFAVEDPDSGKLQVVSIMGNGGEVFAVQSYLPDEGIRFWNDFIDSEGLPDEDLLMYDTRMVSCEFVGKDEHAMFPLDEELNQRFGLDCKRGPLELCAFRSYLPGCYPWHMDEDEAQTLLNALRLVPRFAKEHSDLLRRCYVPELGSFMPMIPAYHLPKGTEQTNPSSWERRIVPFPEAPPKQAPEVSRDDLFIQRLSSLTITQDICWEVGSFRPGIPVLRDGRPRWQEVSFVAVRPEGFVHGTTVETVDSNPVIAIRRSFAAAAQKLGYLPAKVYVAHDVHAAALADLTLEMSVQVNRVASQDQLALFQEASREIAMSLGGPPQLPPDIMEAMNELLAGEGISGTGSPEDLAKLKTLLDGVDPSDLIGHIGNSPGGMPSLAALSGDDNSLKSLYKSPKSRERYVIRVDLKGAKPPIWRRFSLPIDASFFDLHVAIQDTFGWHNCHLHEFQLREHGQAVVSFNFGLEDTGFAQSACEFRNCLRDVYEDGFDVIHYTYDFGDDWEHKIKIEKLITTDEVQPQAIFLKGRGACPPEDCGGIWTYQTILHGEMPEDAFSTEEQEAIRSETFDPNEIHHSDIHAMIVQLEFMSG